MNIVIKVEQEIEQRVPVSVVKRPTFVNNVWYCPICFDNHNTYEIANKCCKKGIKNVNLAIQK